MLEQLLQFLITGVTVGSTYALVGLGFAIIYNASDVVNFSQGEFVMIGAMSAISLLAVGVPYIPALFAAVAIAVCVGMMLQKFAIQPAKGASVVTMIIITIGASIFLRGAAQLVWGKNFHVLPPFTGEEPIRVAGATILPQSLWVMGVTAVLVLLVRYFFTRTELGKAVLACSYNKTAAHLVGINVNLMLLMAFAISAFLGGTAGLLIAPITFMSYDAGIMLALKGFSAAIIGGMGNPMGAVAGGVLLGVLESFGTGLISSGYKDAIAFIIILMVLFFRPSGLFGKRFAERV